MFIVKWLVFEVLWWSGFLILGGLLAGVLTSCTEKVEYVVEDKIEEPEIIHPEKVERKKVQKKVSEDGVIYYEEEVAPGVINTIERRPVKPGAEQGR